MERDAVTRQRTNNGRSCRTARGGTPARRLHLWTQIVGKVRLVQTPWLNHSWHVTALCHRARPDDLAHSLRRSGRSRSSSTSSITSSRVETSDGRPRHVALAPRTVADFYARRDGGARSLGHRRRHRRRRPTRVADAIPVRARTARTRPTTPSTRTRFWRVLVQVDRVFKAVPGALHRASAVRCTSSGAASTWR